MTKLQQPYWQAHRKFSQKGRLAWYAEPADDVFWFSIWQAKVTPTYYQSARNLSLSSHELGRILLDTCNPDGVHLEAGCGAGYWVAALQNHGYTVEGIEYSEELVNLVHCTDRQLNVRYDDALAINCPDESYDSYLSFGVVEHLESGPEPFLYEAYRVLKPGGKLIISVPHFGVVRRLKARLGAFESTKPTNEFFQYGFSAKEFTQIIREAKFQVDGVYFLSPERLLAEEVTLFRFLMRQRGARFLKKLVQLLFKNYDGHLVLVVGHK